MSPGLATDDWYSRSGATMVERESTLLWCMRVGPSSGNCVTARGTARWPNPLLVNSTTVGFGALLQHLL